MYWYKKQSIYRKAVVVFTTALLFSCQSATEKKSIQQKQFIDIPSFIKTEIERLSKENPTVHKTVTKDSVSETKDLKINRWANELSSFTTVDLNKPAYAGYLTKDSTAGKVVIRSSNPKLDLSSVEIDYEANGKPMQLRIERTIKNSLYQTKETLVYAKDKGYSLEKKQTVFILGDKYYRIDGTLK